MIEATIAALPPAPLHALEIWSDPHGVAARFAAFGLPLPPAGRSAALGGLTLIRFEPTVWLVEGEAAAIVPILGDDGALTAIGGGVVRVRIAGAGWRRLLMEGGVFDAEAASFAPGCSAATIIDHVGLRLWVESALACRVYVPASYAAGLIHFWERLTLLTGR